MSPGGLSRRGRPRWHSSRGPLGGFTASSRATPPPPAPIGRLTPGSASVRPERKSTLNASRIPLAITDLEVEFGVRQGPRQIPETQLPDAGRDPFELRPEVFSGLDAIDVEIRGHLERRHV